MSEEWKPIAEKPDRTSWLIVINDNIYGGQPQIIYFTGPEDNWFIYTSSDHRREITPPKLYSDGHTHWMYVQRTPCEQAHNLKVKDAQDKTQKTD